MYAYIYIYILYILDHTSTYVSENWLEILDVDIDVDPTRCLKIWLRTAARPARPWASSTMGYAENGGFTATAWQFEAIFIVMNQWI